MNITIVTKNFYPAGDANSNILYRVALYFAGQGHRITVARIVSDSERWEDSRHGGIRIISIPMDMRGWGGNARSHLLQGRMLLAAHGAAMLWVTRAFGQFIDIETLPQFRSNAQILEQIIEESHADVLLTHGTPFSTHYFGYILKRRRGMGWIMYMLDPYFNNPTLDSSGRAVARRVAEELRMLEATDKAVATPEIHGSYVKPPLAKHSGKVTPLELPMIRDLTDELGTQVAIDNHYINCSFVGNLYPDLRDPQFVLRVFHKIRQPNIRLNMIGKTYGRFPAGYISALTEPLGDRFASWPPVHPDAAIAWMCQSDVLVNIGNRGTDMFPSKFLDYCSTGRPIINFYWSPDCPTLPYARKYGLCLNVQIDDTNTEDAAKQVEAFILANASYRLSYDEVTKNLGVRSSDSVAAEFLEVLECVARDVNILRSSG